MTSVEILKKCALFEGHLGLVDHKTNALFVVEADALVGADEVLATYSGGT